MKSLSQHYHRMITNFPKSQIMIVFDIDDTIVDIRIPLLYVLKKYGTNHNTYHFAKLVLEDIIFEEWHIQDWLPEIVFEKDERVGGLLRYGIPDFKLAKNVIDRRLQQLSAEGIEFQTGVDVGTDVSARYLKKRFDCICLAMGAGHPRDLNIVGRGYDNIMFAMDYLKTQNKICNGEPVDESKIITAKNKVVVVIGGGDTGSDCVGTAKRQGAKQIYQLEILPKPPETRPPDTLWPMWPRIMRSSSCHGEGCERRWSVMTKKFSGVETRLTQLRGCEVQWQRKGGGAGHEGDLEEDGPGRQRLCRLA